MLQWIRNAFGPLSTGSAGLRAQTSVRDWMEQAQARYGAGDLDGAEALYQRVLDDQPDHAQALCRMGEIEALRRNNELAAGLIRRAISIDEKDPQFHYALGCALQASGERNAAVESYRGALALDSSHAAAHINLGVLLQAQAELDIATAPASRAAAEQGLEEARSHFLAATETASEDPNAWINLGYAHERQRDLAGARHCYDRALAINTDLPDARFNRSMVLLAQGDWLQGWQDYEWRWPASGYPRPVFPQPEWDGSALAGETVLLYTEQGFGDAIQFVRYAALVEARGGRAIVRCSEELRRLFESVPGVAATFAPGDSPAFDLHCSLLSLPRVLRTTADKIPGQLPYIRPDAGLTDQWRARVRGCGSAFNVGLVWASYSTMPNAALKSMLPQALTPLRGMDGVRFFSLQPGEAGKRAGQTAPIPLTDLTDEIHDFADTAALIASLDLVISVDTAVAHLAGAMGIPVWTLLAYAPDWRWYPDGATSLWYPGMRLYRQPRQGDWAAVCAQVAEALRDCTARRSLAGHDHQ